MNEPAGQALPATLPTLPQSSGRASSHPRPVVPEHFLLRCIGQGAYGEVWLARNGMGVRRAVKVVYRDSFRDEQPYEREFKGIRCFEPISRSHDGFVDILQVGRDDQAGYFYYVMELADEAAVVPEPSRGNSVDSAEVGPLVSAETYNPRTLRHELQRRGRLPFDESLQLALSLTLTLGHLHRQGLIHRDIKPSNIIFVNGVPKLADVGLVTDVSEARTYVGTEGFMPPEGPNSTQADIYSLGKVLYEISTGKDRKQFPEPITDFGDVENSAGYAELNAVILKACATDPSDRYWSTEELHLDLALLQGGKSVRGKRVLERRLALLTRLTTVGIAVTASLVAGYFYQQRQTEIANRLAAELQITHGIHVLDQGDSAGASLWFMKALEQAHWTKDEVEMHRLRLGAVLQHCPKLVRLFPHEHGAGRMEFSPDGRRLLTYFWTTNVQVFDVAAGESLVVLRHSNLVWHAAFDVDGERVVTLSGPEYSTHAPAENEVRVWSVSTGSPIGPTIRHSARAPHVITGSDEDASEIWDSLGGANLGPNLNRLPRVAFSRDGKNVMTADADTVQVWNPRSGKPKGPSFRPSGNGTLLGVAPDGRSMLTASGLSMNLRAIRTGESLLLHFEHAFSSSDHNPATIIGKFSSGGQKVIGIGFDGEFTQVWDATTGKPLLMRSNTPDADFSPGGDWVAIAGGDGSARILESGTGMPVTSPARHAGMVWGVRFHPDGRRFATANGEKLVRLWDIAPHPFSGPVFRHADRLTWAGFTPDGNRILTASRDGTARLWDGSGNEVLPAMEHRGSWVDGRLSLDRDGKRVVTARADDVIQSWNVDTGEPLGRAMRHRAAVHHAELSPDGRLLVTTTEDGSVELWDAQTGLAVDRAIPRLARAAWASFSPDGRRLATIGHATLTSIQAQVWDVATGQSLTQPMPIGISSGYSVSFSLDGTRILTRAFNGEARVWDAHTGQPITPVLTHGKSPILAACFSPEGRRVLTAGDSARLWDAATGRPLTRPLGHRAPVGHAAFSPDGRRIVTASTDRTARLWDASSGLPLTPPLQHRDEVTYAEFSPDGRRVVTACADGTARLWQFEPLMWPVEDLRLLAQLLSGQTIDDTGSFVFLTPKDLQETLKTLESRHADYFGPGR